MFERLILKVAAQADEAARRRRRALAEALRAEVPDEMWVSEDEVAVVLRGLGLGRRFALDSDLRWLPVRGLDRVGQGRRR